MLMRDRTQSRRGTNDLAWRARQSISSRRSRPARARVNAETSIRCKPSDTACREAEYLATTKAGVVTFAKSGDAELGEYGDDEPTIIFKAGRLPALFEEA